MTEPAETEPGITHPFRSTAQLAAERGMTPTAYRAASHQAAVTTIRAAARGLYAGVGIRVLAVLDEDPPVIRCADAVWTDRCRTPHTWQQGPDTQPVRCPGSGGAAHDKEA